MSSFEDIEARGLGASDIQDVERYLNRIQVEKHQARSARARPSASAKLPRSSHRNKPLAADQSTPTPCSPPQSFDHLRLLHPTEMKLGIERNGRHKGSASASESRSALGQSNTRVIGQNAIRHMTVDCGLKSPQTSGRKWAESKSTVEDIILSASKSPIKPLQSQIFFFEAGETSSIRRGLSGSKIRSGARTPKRDLHTPRLQLLDSGQDHREGGSVLNASTPRCQTIRFSQASLTVSGENENCQPRVGGCKWNSSEQALRLQKQLTSMTSTRAMKRASEMVHHRLDPMYLMSGNKVMLQNRYSIDDTEMQRLQEMTETREGMVSDLHKIKYPYGVRPQTHYMNGLKHQSMQMNNMGITESSLLAIQGRENLSAGGSLHSTTPASDSDLVKNNAMGHDNMPLQVSEAKVEATGADHEDEINSWNGPL